MGLIASAGAGLEIGAALGGTLAGLISAIGMWVTRGDRQHEAEDERLDRALGYCRKDLERCQQRCRELEDENVALMRKLLTQ